MAHCPDGESALVLGCTAERDKLWSRNPLKRLTLWMRAALGNLSVVEKVHLDAFSYPHYAYGIYVACLQAKMLGVPKITVIEFGVAGGNGLIAMEEAAAEIGGHLGIEVHVLGVDQGAAGLPASSDHRDMVYWYKPGAYSMDEPKLRARLKRAHLVIGDIKTTLAPLKSQITSPVGFCSLDMDYYSSTVSALQLFDDEQKNWLPRVMLYADDIFGSDDLNIMSRDVGEEAAFCDFNTSHAEMKISVVRGLGHKRPRPAAWNEKIFALHDFSHPLYNKNINPRGPGAVARLLSLRG